MSYNEERAAGHVIKVIKDMAYGLYKASVFGRKPFPGVVVDTYNPDQPSFPDKTPQIARDLLGCGYDVGEIIFPTVIVSTPTPFKPYKRRTRNFKKRALRKKHGPRPYRRPLW